MIPRRQWLIAGASAAACAFTRAAGAGGRFRSVFEQLRRLVTQGTLPFAALRIAQHGEILAQEHSAGREPIGSDSLYRIYSMTLPGWPRR